MSGLRKLCKLYGRVTAKSSDGTTIKYVWDYAIDGPVAEEQMPVGSARWEASEKARFLLFPPRTALHCAASACPGCTVCEPEKEAERIGEVSEK